MGFPKRHLQEGEEIVAERRPHLVTFAKPVLLLIFSIVAGAAAAKYINPRSDSINNWVSLGALVIPILSLLWIFAHWLRWRTTLFVVTTERLISRAGLFSRSGMEIPLERVNNISSHQTFFERMVGAGDLVIESGGEGGQERYTDVNKPFELQNQINRQIERAKARDMDRMAGRREFSVPEQIEKLAELVKTGVVTQAEFDAKKSQLLDKLQ
jgi:uncharacterized membrane protein YdbT with pleckstrin-like domain